MARINELYENCNFFRYFHTLKNLFKINVYIWKQMNNMKTAFFFRYLYKFNEFNF